MVLFRLAAVSLAVLAVGRAASALVPGIPAPALVIELPGDGADPAARLRQAMLSVHAFVEKRRAPLKPLLLNVATPPMTKAAQAIVDSRLPLAPLARLLAVVRLVAHARGEADTGPAVDILLGERQRVALYHWLDAHPAPGGCEVDVEKHVAVGLKVVLGEQQPSVFAMAGSCTDFYPYAHVDSPSGTNDVSISMIADAGRKLDDTRPKLDPRSWAGCSTLWAETYLVETDQNGMPVYQNGKPKKKNLSQALGESYQNEMLYEDVKCDGKCGLQMLLDVTSWKPTNNNSYTVQYSRKDQLGGSPKLIGDDGYIKAVKNGNRVSVESQKTLGFADSADADLVYAVLQAIDLTAHLERLVCCP